MNTERPFCQDFFAKKTISTLQSVHSSSLPLSLSASCRRWRWCAGRRRGWRREWRWQECPHHFTQRFTPAGGVRTHHKPDRNNRSTATLCNRRPQSAIIPLHSMGSKYVKTFTQQTRHDRWYGKMADAKNAKKQGGPENPQARRHTARLFLKMLWCGQLCSGRNWCKIFTETSCALMV